MGKGGKREEGETPTLGCKGGELAPRSLMGATASEGKSPCLPLASPSHQPSSTPLGVFVLTTLIISCSLNDNSPLLLASKS